MNVYSSYAGPFMVIVLARCAGSPGKLALEKLRSNFVESISYTYFPNLELYAPDLEGQILKAGIEFLVELR